jgi:hypothetical protein
MRLFLSMAEGQRFELWVPCGTAVFKTAALNHSAIPPDVRQGQYIFSSDFVKIFLTFYIHPVSKAIEPISLLDRVLIYRHSLISTEKCRDKYEKGRLREMKVRHEVIHDAERNTRIDIDLSFEYNTLFSNFRIFYDISCYSYSELVPVVLYLL